ncbi:MAG TPA: hypothetical protein VK427_03405, partial [Kofleriaceae bacterium]|nr:hypothetical protein [Kofleriaceae bacterium]
QAPIASRSQPGSAATISRADSAGTAPGDATVALPSESRGVRRLDREARAELARRIDAARAKARETARARGEPAPVETLSLDDVGASLRQHLDATIPLLHACYGAQDAAFEATAVMALSTDPELGTVIDTDDIHDASGAPLQPRSPSACAIRSTRSRCLRWPRLLASCRSSTRSGKCDLQRGGMVEHGRAVADRRHT